jgi:DNA invertase Pin-like site-specific DNA recombinase
MSSNTNGNGKPLRFAALVRVSTEAQERQGESLLTQRKANARDVERLGGTLVGVYGGQEHATPGWEHKEVIRLLADAARGRFDAVMVAYADRWSRDNAKSKEGLEVFRKAGVRFFVGSMEMDLFDPNARFILGMHAEVGEFIARQQAKKSYESRIERAQKGVPTCGKMPFGRTFDRDTGEWGIDPAKQAVIADVAKRYLAGESLTKLAKEYRLSHSNLCKTLREYSGTEWSFEFRSDDLNIAEAVTVRVPRLLPEETIRLVRHRLESRRARPQKGKDKDAPPVYSKIGYLRGGGRRVHDYPLGGHIFCAVCGYNLTGQLNQRGKRYYRHTHADRALDCPLRPRPWVPADKIEDEVVGQLFNMFGNPAAIERAIKAAVPDCEEALRRRGRLAADLAKVEKAQGRLIDAIADGLLTRDQARRKVDELKGREGALRAELDKIDATLADVPDEGAVRLYVERFGSSGTSYGNVRDEDGNPVTRPYDNVEVIDDSGQTYVGGNSLGTWLVMTRPEKLALVQAAFATPLRDGTPAGVYVAPAAGASPYRSKRWTFTLRGWLEFERVVPRVRE